MFFEICGVISIICIVLGIFFKINDSCCEVNALGRSCTCNPDHY
jgi:hypothetical protein